MASGNILGIDIGSVSIGLVTVTPERHVIYSAYGFHHGDIPGCLEGLLDGVDMASVNAVAATEGTPALIFADRRYDHQIALIRAVKALHPEAGGILTVGGEKFKRIRFDENGEYAGSRTNTACAAGTGSFLDQQASRLNLAGIQQLSELSINNKNRIPKIATRCAVFAKTDLIHAQQEGYELSEICEGLCRGLAKNLADTLFFEDQPPKPLIFCGGVSQNAAVLNHISELTGARLFADELSHLYEAIGAVFHLIDEGVDIPEGRFAAPSDLVYARSGRKQCDNPPLQLKLSDYPAFESRQSYDFTVADDTYQNKVEVDVYEELTSDKPVAMYIGMDIGSTSTKAVWLNPDKTVLAGFYTK